VVLLTSRKLATTCRSTSIESELELLVSYPEDQAAGRSPLIRMGADRPAHRGAIPCAACGVVIDKPALLHSRRTRLAAVHIDKGARGGAALSWRPESRSSSCTAAEQAKNLPLGP
jgi:hypothetical protein